VAAVSGGPDSTALFILLADLRDSSRAFPELLAGHVHHGLRGRDADLDEECARSLAASRAARFLVHRGDARAEAERRRLSPEAGARALRLAGFLEWARSGEVDAIALAHHLDDVAETVLLRAARGAGIRGIRGIPGERTLLRGGGSSVLLVRPLLEVRREDLARFLEERSQAYRVDRTNLDPTIPRNRVRLEVLPALEAAHPGAAGNIARFARIARGWARDLEVLGRRAYREALRPSREKGAVELDAERLRMSPPSVLHESLRIAIDEARRATGVEDDIPAASSLDARASASLRGWIAHPARGPATLRIRGGMEIELRYGRVRIRRASDPGASGSGEPVPVPVVLGGGAGELRWGAWRFIARHLAPGEAPARPGSPERHRESLDAEKLEAAGALRVRARRRGESFHPLGAPGSKALKEFLRERRVRPDERDAVPLVAAGDSIAWVVGHRIAHPFRITGETRRVLEIEAWREG
jgi:tRNA(Ile)-lysidine synthase